MLDLKISNCSIFGNEDEAEIGIKKGKIVLIEKEILEKSVLNIDLNGAFVAPGFIDTHTHLLNLGLEKLRTSLFNTTSKEDAIDLLKKNIGSRKSTKILVAYRWDESLWKNGTFLNRSDLDFTTKPIIAYRRDGHMATLNSSALKIVDKEDSKDGILKESELRLLTPLVYPDNNETKEALKLGMQEAIKVGITALRDNVDAHTYSTYTKINQPILVKKMIYDNELFDDFGRSIHEDWGVKTFLDGSIGAFTAAHKGWNKKNLLKNKFVFEKFCKNIWSRNHSIAVHAIGENAVRTAVMVFSKNSGSRRNSIEHFEIIDDNILDMMNDSIVVSSQPNFLEWAREGGMYENRLGKEYLQKNNMYREFLDRGIKLAFGSDTMPIGPLYGIHYAVNSSFHNQRISVEEAIKCYTEGSAYCLGMEGMKGKLDLGYDADIVVLNRDPTKNLKGKIKDIKVKATFIGGKKIYDSENVKFD